MGQNVVELSQYRDHDHFPALRALGNYWLNLAGGAVPNRSDLDPRGLPDALRNIVLMERISTGNARIRISGKYLCDVLHADGRRLPYSLLFESESRSLALDILGQVFEAKCPKHCDWDAWMAHGAEKCFSRYGVHMGLQIWWSQGLKAVRHYQILLNSVRS